MVDCKRRQTLTDRKYGDNIDFESEKVVYGDHSEDTDIN